MGAYDSSRFSKMFSERTEANYRYISKAVNRDEEEKRIQKEFLEKYTQVIKEIDVIKNELRREAGQIVNVQKKGKSELKRKLFSFSSSVEDSAKKLQSDLESLVSTEAIEGQKLYEVTQLLNSLMGIAVLPYEMHKEYFKYVDEDEKSEENSKKNMREIRNTVKNTGEYNELKKYIMMLGSKAPL